MPVVGQRCTAFDCARARPGEIKSQCARRASASAYGSMHQSRYLANDKTRLTAIMIDMVYYL
jgi:hypothetical protein